MTARPRTGALAVALLLLAPHLGFAAEAPPPASAGGEFGPVRVSWPAEPPTVGDLVPVDVLLTLDADATAGEPRFPTWGDSWGEAEIVEVGEVEATAPGVWRQSLVLAAFRTGSVSLPPREFLVPDEAGRSRRFTTPPELALEVVSVLPQPADGAESEAGDDTIPEPMAARSMVKLPIGAAFWWTATTMVATILGLAWLHHRRTGAPGAARSTAALPPAGELRAALDEARRAAAPADGLVTVSHALRRYLGRRLAFPALESTTTEIRRRLHGAALPAGSPAQGLDRRVAEILAACDLVKFARRPAVHADVEHQAAAAEAVARDLETHFAPAVDSTLPQPGAEAAA